LQVPDQLDPYIQTVLAQWPELMAAQMTAEIERSRIKAAIASGRPELDLILGYSSSGLRTSSADALSQSLEGRHPSWYVGLHLEVMLGANKRSRAESEAAGLRALQAELDARTIRSNVAHRLRARVEGALSAHEDMQRMVRREVLQREIHLEQVALFEAGQIAVDALYRSMDDVIDVQRRLTDAQVQYQLAIISLRLIEGSLLPSAGGEARAPSLGFADS
jgi:outer membrane protein TolC